MNDAADMSFEEAMRDIMDGINQDLATKHAPCHSLVDMLMLLTMDQLREEARMHDIPNRSKLKKAELCSLLAESISTVDFLGAVLATVNGEQFKFFTEAAQADACTGELVIPPHYEWFQRLRLLQVYQHEGAFWVIVPNEVKAAYNELQNTNFAEVRQRHNLMNHYARAVVGLYGVMTLDDFRALLMRYGKVDMGKLEAEQTLEIMGKNDEGYCVWGKYLVDSEFEEDDFEDVEYYAETAASKPRYMPPKTELLRYADWDYYEHTPQVRALQSYLTTFIMDDPEEVQAFVDEIHSLCMQGEGVKGCFDLLNENEISLSFQEVEELTQLVMNMQNNTRIWLNNGHTPAELFQEEAKHLRALPEKAVPKKKIGRNDPCPCGSGKKYKKCCLLKLN